MMKKQILFCLLILFTFQVFGQHIEEIDYDQPGTDSEEFIDVVLPIGESPADYQLILYNGNGGAMYNTITLSDPDVTCVAWSPTAQLCTWDPTGNDKIQNGAPDGVVLYNSATTTIIQLISYEGSFTPIDGVANGLLLPDIGVSETNSSPNLSMQWNGSTWVTGTPLKASVLPVKLARFDVQSKGQTGIIQWATTGEINNSHFEIHRSKDGEEYYAVGKVRGQGNTSQKAEYEFLDQDLRPGTYYYQLRQVDLDGQSEIFGPVRLKISGGNLSIRPSFVAQKVYFDGEMTTGTDVSFYTLSGQLVWQTPLETELDVTHLPSGTYLVKVGDVTEQIFKY